MQRNSKLVILSNLGMTGHTQLKWYHQCEKTFNICQQAKNQLHPSCFPWDITKILLTGCFWYFGPIWLLSPKVILPSYRKHLCLSVGKTSTSSPILLWGYCKNIQIYFGYFGHARSHALKMIVSPWQRLQCLSACKK